ncbi:MAG: ADP-ribosylglycohydrolase family protein [Actinobacteria bacterium]|nr:ADP-ribosylglycohydrolase family protein [Actinomycetota bacterium]
MDTFPRWADPFVSALAQNRVLTTALLAFAAGDAFGVYYEFLPRGNKTIPQDLKEKEGWPFGGVSDDTLLTLLTIQGLHASTPAHGAEKFLTLLRENISQLRGLGPTTRTALGLPVRADERGEIGNTNGAIMRTALLGLYFEVDSATQRREWVESLVRATHNSQGAVACAHISSALFSNHETSIVEVIQSELAVLKNVPEEITRIEESLEIWNPPANGISLDPLETLLAVIWVVNRAKNCADAYSLACLLGGDTDTVAALSGSLFTVRNPEVAHFFDIPWLTKIDWKEIVIGVNDAIEVEHR